jgi:hypothetical protein
VSARRSDGKIEIKARRLCHIMQKSMVFEPNFCLTFLKLEIDGNVEEIEINLHNLIVSKVSRVIFIKRK